MNHVKPNHSREEHARRGQELYENSIRPQVEADHRNRIVAIDIDSGAYEVADDTLTASGRLLARHPEAQPWVVRVGHKALHRFGGASGLV